MDAPGALFDAAHAPVAAFFAGADVDTASVIAHGQRQGARTIFDDDFVLPCVRMPEGVAQGFPSDGAQLLLHDRMQRPGRTFAA